MGIEGKKSPNLEKALNEAKGPVLKGLKVLLFICRVRLKGFLMFQRYWILGRPFL